MADYKVTLQADLKRGTFYWVTTVSASSEDEAIIAAEHKFMEEVAKTTDFEFNEFDVENL